MKQYLKLLIKIKQQLKFLSYQARHVDMVFFFPHFNKNTFQKHLDSTSSNKYIFFTLVIPPILIYTIIKTLVAQTLRKLNVN
jgi:hypothetical protein